MMVKSEAMKMKCPYCGEVLNIDQIYMNQMEERFKESHNRLLEEAVANQKASDEADTQDKINIAVEKAKSQQQGQIEKLLAQIEILTQTISSNAEESKKAQEEIFKLQQKAQSVDLKIQKKVNEKTAEIYQEARQKADEEKGLEIAALHKKLDDANTVTQDLQKKLDQGSQQLQGEVQELNLAMCLRGEFFLDEIEEVATGKLGADIIQTVKDRTGRECGKIVWESKNVKNWKNEFIPKLRSDMQRVNGDIGVLVSNVFGKNMQEFAEQDGVWLVKPIDVLAMARLMRDGIIRANNIKVLAEHKDSVQGAVYEFVTSTQFRNRIENIGRQYRALDVEINKTKDVMNSHWATQRKLIDQLIENTQGVLGDVSAFMLTEGSDVPELDSPDNGSNDSLPTH